MFNHAKHLMEILSKRHHTNKKYNFSTWDLTFSNQNSTNGAGRPGDHEILSCSMPKKWPFKCFTCLECLLFGFDIII